MSEVGIEKPASVHNPHPAAPPRLALPALNFHRAWWFPEDDTGRGSSAAKKLLAAQILALFKRCKEGGDLVVTKIDGVKVGEHQQTFEFMGIDVSKYLTKRSDVANLSDVDVFSMALSWNNRPVRLHIAVHSEYFSITLWAMFVRKLDPASSDPNAAREECRDQIFWPHLEILANLLTEASTSETFNKTNKFDNPAISKATKALYDTHNNRLFATLFPRSARNRFNAHKMFADFRSIILPSQASLDGEVSTTEKSFKNPGPILDTMAAIFNANSNVDENSLPELMGSLFLKGRVAYVSSLGSHHADSPSVKSAEGQSNKVLPVRYLMYADEVCRWQMGRLVERLNKLGTYRLASVRDIEPLNKVSDGLRKIGHELDQLDLTKSTDVENKFREQYKIFNSLSKSGTSKLLRRDGITFRIERSRFYVDAFHRLVEDLGTKGLQGFQSYPDFVRRRYGGTWDRIDRIGIRHERLAKRLDYLSNLRQTTQLRQLLTSNVGQTTKLKNLVTSNVDQTTQLTLLSKSNVDQTTQLTQLLQTAERVSVIPIAYYGKEQFSKLLGAFGAKVSDSAAFFLIVGIFSAFMLGFMVRRYRSDKEKPELGEVRWWSISFVLALIFFGVMMVQLG